LCEVQQRANATTIHLLGLANGRRLSTKGGVAFAIFSDLLQRRWRIMLV